MTDQADLLAQFSNILATRVEATSTRLSPSASRTSGT